MRLYVTMMGVAAALCLAGCASTVTCTSAISNASYTGPYKGVDNNLHAEDFHRDMACAQAFRNDKYPNGFLTVYGSSRIRESNTLPDASAAQANNELYRALMVFAEQWTRKHGKQLPVMTGAGPGLMEAASRGAMKAGGPSIGYTTYYDPEPRGDADEAFWKYKDQAIITDGLIFSSVAMRETAMFLHSAVVVIAPGGTGTEWEIFQILESVKSAQLKKVPIYLVGNKQTHWQSFYARIDDMARRGTVRAGELAAHFTHVEKIDDLLDTVERDLAASLPH
jgi:predicted Rossmann-fold nucleotide-binding protein